MIASHNIQKQWYVIVYKTMHYTRAANILERLGFSFYLPIQRQLHYWSDRKRWVDVPILNPYIFLFANKTERNLIFQSCSCFHFLTSDSKLAIAKEEEVEKIKMLCNYTAPIKMEACSIKKGDLVKVTGGPLSGMQGYALQENGKHRLLIRILSLGQFASVDIDSSWLSTC